MRRYIEHLRTKPDHKKRQIAFGVSTLIMIGIVTILVSTFSIRFPGLVLNSEAKTENKRNQAASLSNAATGETTLEELKRRLGSEYAEVEDLIENSNDTNGVTISDPNYSDTN